MYSEQEIDAMIARAITMNPSLARIPGAVEAMRDQYRGGSRTALPTLAAARPIDTRGGSNPLLGNPTSAALNVSDRINATNQIMNTAYGPGGQPGSSAAAKTPAQLREEAMMVGRNYWNTLTRENPDYMANLARYKDMSQGLNAQEMLAAREDMARGIQGQQQSAMRRLYSSQNRAGIRGGMAGAQAARLQQQGMRDRQAAEQKLLLDNYALRRTGLKDWSDALNRDISGNLASGMGWAQLDVADRTAADQDRINRAALLANRGY